MFRSRIPDHLEAIPVESSHARTPATLREVALRLKLAHTRGGADADRVRAVLAALRRLQRESKQVGDAELLEVLEPLEQSAVELLQVADPEGDAVGD